MDVANATSLVAMVEANPVIVLTDAAKFNQFYEDMKRETDALHVDLTTEKGRKAIASMAFKVARTKTAIDEAGKKLNEDARTKINLVDAARREIRDKLDALKDDVRAPLTAWEKAEEDRNTECKETIARLKALAVIGAGDTAAEIAERLSEAVGAQVDEARFIEWFPIANAAKQNAIAALRAAQNRIAKEEADRVELERLRAQAAEREARDLAERQAAEAEAREAAEQKAAAEREAASAKAQAERQARAEAEEIARREAAAQAAADAARIEAQRVAREAAEAQERAHAEAIAGERRKAEESERARQAEAKRTADEQKAREAEAQRQAAADAARAADREHRGKIMAAAKEALIEAGPMKEAVAKAVVLAIAAGSIPHVSIRF